MTIEWRLKIGDYRGEIETPILKNSEYRGGKTSCPACPEPKLRLRKLGSFLAITAGIAGLNYAAGIAVAAGPADPNNPFLIQVSPRWPGSILTVSAFG